MTPSRPAPSKRRNQSDATLESRVAGVRWIGGAAAGKQRLQLAAALLKRLAPQIAIALAEQVEEHDGRRDLLGEQLHARRGRMEAELQRLEIEAAIPGDDDFAVEHAAGGQLRQQRLEQLGKVAVERFFVAALDQDLVAVAEDQRAKPVPLRLENPRSVAGQFVNSLGEHRQDRRIDGKVHASCYTARVNPQALVSQAANRLVFRKSLRNFPFGSYRAASCRKSDSFSYLDRSSAGGSVNNFPQ